MTERHPDRDPEFLKRRQVARERLDELTGAIGGDHEDRQTWFQTVYDTADGDPAQVPWADLAPHPLLADWLRSNPLDAGQAVLDIGCGLGDNAEAFAKQGGHVTAFDLSETAIAWAKRRFPDTDVTYSAADLFAAPAEWASAFDLVHECYTVQALRGLDRARAFEKIAGFVRPGGHLLVITRSRAPSADVGGPPWPLDRDELDGFAQFGLKLSSLDEIITAKEDREIPHFRALFRRAE